MEGASSKSKELQSQAKHQIEFYSKRLSSGVLSETSSDRYRNLITKTKLESAAWEIGKEAASRLLKGPVVETIDEHSRTDKSNKGKDGSP